MIGVWLPRRAFSSAREIIQTDVLIVGAGPAGLSAAIRLKQLSPNLGVTVLEKGSEIGAHIVSGVCFEPRALDELLPKWRQMESDPFPLQTMVQSDQFAWLTANRALFLPYIPAALRNEGNYLGSLSEVTRWLGRRAEEAGVEIYPGFAGAEVLFGGTGRVIGVATNDLGLDRLGRPKDSFQPGLAIHAHFTLLAEGAHGSLTKGLIERFGLRRHPQTYGLGIKEVWEIPRDKHRPGSVLHTVGWPLNSAAKGHPYGGSFVYHYGDGLVSLGLVIGLDYRNPWLWPYGEMQTLKTHPLFRKLLEGGGGKCVGYGARVINEGGWQSIPRMGMARAGLLGCSAGLVNVAKIKGTHTAMKSGIIAAEVIREARGGEDPFESGFYDRRIRESWIGEELRAVRNIRPAFSRFGLVGGMLWSGIDLTLLKGRGLTLSHPTAGDHSCTQPATACVKIEYPKADGKLTFPLLESVSRTGTDHQEDQPVHLRLTDPAIPTRKSFQRYRGLEERFCPAGVYEYLGEDRFQINAQNCIHCKTCDIKDPAQNINWTVPEGGGGPKYSNT